MEQVLEGLRHTYPGQLQVDFIDVAIDPEAGRRHGIALIPTQIFFDAAGREVFRHEGFIPTEDVVARWRELGVTLQPAAAAPPPGPLQRLFGGLGRALEGGPWLALGAALLWGILSVLLSPCHLASIPLIVGYVDGQEGRRACLTSTLFALGILVTIAMVGALTAAAGRLLGQLGSWSTYLAAAVLAAVGLHLLDVLPAPWSGAGLAGWQRRGLLGAFLLGLVFGVALGPCTFAYLAPLLAVTFALAGTQLLFGVLLLAVYGLGHCLVIVVAGTATGLVRRVLHWTETSRGSALLRWICGGLVLVAALYMLWLAGPATS
jgi:cytochrome c-type biogenesis protein